MVYKESEQNQMDTRNHNPRVGGSSPSSATTNQQLSDNDGGRFTNRCKPSDFPGADDWAGWVDLWCRDDTGNIDCVPECLRPPIMHLVRPDGWLIDPNLVPSSPYTIARWFHFGSGLPMPPWIGMGLNPDQAKRLWLEKIASEDQAFKDADVESVEFGDLYFIGSDDGPIKIGVSVAPKKRLKGLQTGYPHKLRILCLLPGAAMEEPVYHERFAAHRLEGEWFSRHPEILAEIDRLNQSPSSNGRAG